VKTRADAAYEKQGAKLTVTSILLKVIVEALKRHPLFNASLDESAHELVLKQYYHLGIAVDTEAGLMVPVLRDVDKKSTLALSKELAELVEKTRQRKVSLEEMQGGTFTISNQGGIGGGAFTPIIKLPEVAILGLGKAAPKAVVREGAIVARPMLPLGLSYDHRAIDGADAARFVTDLVQAIETVTDTLVKL
jgi:pyruvate dehydrogenase E2 component (dihydrolipoamide acetyltransferase)